MRRKHQTRNPKESRKPRKSSLSVEAIEVNETVKNRFKDARIAMAKNKLKDARIAKVKNESLKNYNGCILWIDLSKLQKLSEV